MKFNTGRGIARKSREYTLIRRLSRSNEALRDLCYKNSRRAEILQGKAYRANEARAYIYTSSQRLSRKNEALRDLCLREKKKATLMRDSVYMKSIFGILTENRIKRMKRKAQSNCAEPLQTTVQALGQLVSLS